MMATSWSNKLAVQGVDGIVGFAHPVRGFRVAGEKGVETLFQHPAAEVRHLGDFRKRLNRGFFAHTLDDLGDSFRVIPHAFQFHRDCVDGEDHAQIPGGRLLGGEDCQARFFHLVAQPV